MSHLSSSRGTKVGILLMLLGAAAACSASKSAAFVSDDSGTVRPDEATGDSGAPADSGSLPDTSAPDAGTPDTSSPQSDSGAAVDTGPAMSADGFGASRTVCINTINALRATDTAVALQPYTLEDTPSLDMCVDTQASNDEAMNSPHYSFINNAPACSWGSQSMAGNTGQDECGEGYGTTAAGIAQCLQDMWNESLQPNCAGCIGCTQYGGACPNCDFSGMNGPECGHYVNMSAPYFTTVACGFGGQAPSSGSAWAVQNFE